MQKCIVRIADGSPETRARLTNFRSQMKLKDPIKKITMGDSIDYAIEQAERVPELEKENMELKERIKELEENPLLSLTYNELESVFYIVRAVDESSDDRMAENCRSASKKLCQALKRN